MDDVPVESFKLSPGWIQFFILAGAILAVTVLAAVWFIAFSQKKKKRKRRPSQGPGRRRRSPRTTLADTGGLPPLRGEEDPPDAT